MLFCKNVVENTYYIPNKAQELKIPISDVYYPGEVADLSRENYLICTVQSEVQDNNQINNVYIIDSDSIETLRNSMTNEI